VTRAGRDPENSADIRVTEAVAINSKLTPNQEMSRPSELAILPAANVRQKLSCRLRSQYQFQNGT
jgi:hypothetical protein